MKTLCKKDGISDELTAILEATLDDVLITDGNGDVLCVSSTFEEMYGIHNSQILGQNVKKLEEKGYFKPSITRLVIEKKQKITMVQENHEGRKIIVSAVPIIEKNGSILKIISFSRDITELMELQEQYKKLERKVEFYSDRISKWELHESENELFIGSSKAIESVIELIGKVAKFDTNVLITGESGVGKTMFARLLHRKSNRSSGELVEVNCGAIPENLIEAELFGYEKGSFTGASKDGKVGLIELANKGTLFLDEIGDLPIGLQVKLLKTIQDKSIIRVGGVEEIPIDFRLISASNRDLKQMTNQRSFREDLYYRLNVIHMEIPALRERKEDIFQLVLYFLKRFNLKYNLQKILTPGTFEAFNRYDWPGNIRELENLMERIILTSNTDIIDESTLPKHICELDITTYAKGNLKDAVEKLEQQMIESAYSRYKTTTGVANELGISQSTAVRKIRKYIQKVN